MNEAESPKEFPRRIIELADTYVRTRGISIARLSTILFNDGKKLELLREGSDLYTETYKSALQWFADHWPEGATWPEGIVRPAPTPVSAEAGR